MEENNIEIIGFSDEFNYNNLLIKYIITRDGHLGLYVKDCALALGVSRVQKRKTGEFTNIRWERVYEDLVAIGILPFEGSYKSFSNKKKQLIRSNLKNTIIYDEEIYLWCKKVQTVCSDLFLQLVRAITTDNILITRPRKEIAFLDKLEEAFKPFNIQGVRQYKVFNYRIDYYIPKLNIAIEYDENNHKNYTYEAHELRQNLIKKELGCKVIRVSDEKSDAYNIGFILKKILFEGIVNRYEII